MLQPLGPGSGGAGGRESQDVPCRWGDLIRRVDVNETQQREALYGRGKDKVAREHQGGLMTVLWRHTGLPAVAHCGYPQHLERWPPCGRHSVTATDYLITQNYHLRVPPG